MSEGDKMQQISGDLCSPLMALPKEIFSYILEYVLISYVPVDLQELLETGKELQVVRGCRYPESWNAVDEGVRDRLNKDIDEKFTMLKFKKYMDVSTVLERLREKIQASRNDAEDREADSEDLLRCGKCLAPCATTSVRILGMKNT